MKPKPTTLAQLASLFCISIILFNGCANQTQEELPNILWLVSEDNSPFAGCYGDEFATTPNLDKLAEDGFLYTHAYANAPVCAPARNTIITGVYANSGGNQHMRSYYTKGEVIRFSPQFLREIGYYCSNNAKEDYNIETSQTKNIWDESSKKAHYKNRKVDQPFFAVFNSSISHESCIHQSTPTNELRHDPKTVPIAPYHPRTPEMEHDWAQYYDKVEDIDSWVGQKLQDLEESGLAENTIVFYYGDHGGVLGRSKRFVYETGTRVPFIIRIPKKYKHLFPEKTTGSKVDRLISFVDLAPTLLSIANISIPEYMQGSAFVGKQKTADPEYAYMFRGRMDERYDMSRAIRDKKFRYIRNYMPYRIYGQYLEYLWRAPSMKSWEQAYNNGECNETQSIFWNTKSAEELYDTENDPWEINNLAQNPEYAEVLQRLRAETTNWSLKIKDTGFIPEAERTDRSGELASYDYFRSGTFKLEPIITAANLAISGDPKNLEQLSGYLNDDDSAIRYWGATGLLILGEKAHSKLKELEKACQDKSADVMAIAAEAIYNLGHKELAKQKLIKGLSSANSFARTHIFNTMDCIDDDSPEIKESVINFLKNIETIDRKEYDIRAAKGLLVKWKINPEDLGLKFNW